MGTSNFLFLKNLFQSHAILGEKSAIADSGRSKGPGLGWGNMISLMKHNLEK